jgi:hypothetical protein
MELNCTERRDGKSIQGIENGEGGGVSKELEEERRFRASEMGRRSGSQQWSIKGKT